MQKVFGISMLMLAAFFIVAIITFNVNDPSWNNINSQEVQNYGGTNGAIAADLLVQAIGYATWLLFIFLIVSGSKLLLKGEKNFLLLKTAGFITLLPFACLAISVLYSHWVGDYANNRYGGFIGTFLKEELMLRMEEKYLFISSIIGIFLISLLALNISLKEWKGFIMTLIKSVVYMLLVINWLGKYLYIKLKNIKLRKGVQNDHDLKEIIIPEAPKARAIIEKKPKLNEVKRLPVQSSLKLEPDDFDLPSSDLLKEHLLNSKKYQVSEAALNQNSKMLQQVLVDFGVNGEINKIYPGPVVTLYELEPSAGTKSSRVIGLADDIARSMSAISARIAVMVGKNALGIELPNAHREIVYLRELLESSSYMDNEAKLPLILGKNIGGEPVIADLAKMPHLLVAGTTGSGKSVAINTMILSLLYKLSPKECQFIMIDPKMLELSVYEGIPHLLTPVVTEAKKAVTALKWVVKEMEGRYKSMSILGVRNIGGFNKAIVDARSKGEVLSKQIQVGFDQEGKPIFENINMPDQPLPYIVVIVDEMADLMIVAGKDIEAYIQRLAQMARAAGIHIIMATQRPSVDVITGVIKANFPTRISFQVTSKIDSRTILGEQGAEQLLGMGDMLYMQGGGRIERVHGPFVGDEEVEAVVSYWKQQGAPQYKVEVTVDTDDEDGGFGMDGEEGDLYEQAVQIVLRDRRPTTSYIQRSLKIGYNRAANLIEQMEQRGVLGAPNSAGKREILIEG